MKSIRNIAVAAAACATLITSGIAQAAVSYAFATSVDSVTLAPGGQASVELFLVETRDEADDVSLLDAENGLSAAQVTVAREQLTGATIDSYVRNTAFELVKYVETAPNAAPYTSIVLTQGQSFSAAAGVGGVDDGLVSRVRLMTLVINAGDVAGVTTFSLSDDPAFDETFTFGTNGTMGQELDDRIVAGLLTVNTVVPEPASLSALAIAGIALRRRRRAAR